MDRNLEKMPSGHERAASTRRARRRLPGWLCIVLLGVSWPAEAAFRLFDAFEDEAVGPIAGQNGWMSSGGDNRVVADPGDSTNQVLYVPSESSILRRSLLDRYVGIANGAVRMVFLRVRVSNKQTFSVGVSGLTFPSEFSDFAPEIGMANSSQNLDLRVWDDDGGNYEIVAQLAADVWYNMWILVDASGDSYQVWLNDRPGASATPADRLLAADGDSAFDFRSGQNSDLFTFFVKTAGGGSSTNFGPVYFDDIYFELTPSSNWTNPVTPNDAAEVRSLVFASDKETLLWNALAWATGYELVRGDLATLASTSGDFSQATNACLEGLVDGDTALDAETPGEGLGYFYLVRGTDGSGVTGTYDSGGAGQVASRDPGIAGSAGACP